MAAGPVDERFGWVTPVSADYASLPVRDAFNWNACPDDLMAGEWYLVAFRSVQHADADQARLDAYDARAHLEASGSAGFVHYFKGPLTDRHECLSFCLWSSRPDARRASGGRSHREAVTLAHEMYEQYTLEFLRLTKRPRERRLRLEAYDQPPSDQPPSDRTAAA